MWGLISRRLGTLAGCERATVTCGVVSGASAERLVWSVHSGRNLAVGRQIEHDRPIMVHALGLLAIGDVIGAKGINARPAAAKRAMNERREPALTGHESNRTCMIACVHGHECFAATLRALAITVPQIDPCMNFRCVSPHCKKRRRADQDDDSA